MRITLVTDFFCLLKTEHQLLLHFQNMPANTGLNNLQCASSKLFAGFNLFNTSNNSVRETLLSFPSHSCRDGGMNGSSKLFQVRQSIRGREGADTHALGTPQLSSQPLCSTEAVATGLGILLLSCPDDSWATLSGFRS